MMKDFDELHKIGTSNMDTALRSFGAISKGAQAIALECADYSKWSFEHGAHAVEKLFGAKSLERVIEVQADYAKAAFEGFVAQATKIGKLYSDVAMEAYKPFDGFFGKVAPSKGPSAV
jgi:hypothetical protein